jgi:thiol-disulfide isomerase/thioredoxin
MNIIKSLVVIITLLLIKGESHAAKIQITTADELNTTLKQRDDSKKVLFFFTSWCPYCKTAIEQVISNQFQDKVVFISLDKNYLQLSAFSPSLPDTVIIYYLSNQSEIMSFFDSYGIRYRGSIPYISVLDEDSELLKDDVSLRQLQRYLK